MTTEILYQQSELVIAIILAILMGLFYIIGFRFSSEKLAKQSDTAKTQSFSIQTATLGLLSLLLGFTFTMAFSRYETRKQLVILESNAIGTAALRAQFLPENFQAEVNDLFIRYVDIRLNSVLRTNQSSPERRAMDADTSQMQVNLWKMAHTAAESEPQSIPLGLFTHAVNQLIDIKAQRDVVVANHIPESVLLLLLGFSILAAGIVGYENGQAGDRIPIPAVSLLIIILLVIIVIIDLDRPQQGLARVSQQSMIELQTILNKIK